MSPPPLSTGPPISNPPANFNAQRPHSCANYPFSRLSMDPLQISRPSYYYVINPHLHQLRFKSLFYGYPPPPGSSGSARASPLVKILISVGFPYEIPRLFWKLLRCLCLLSFAHSQRGPYSLRNSDPYVPPGELGPIFFWFLGVFGSVGDVGCLLRFVSWKVCPFSIFL